MRLTGFDHPEKKLSLACDNRHGPCTNGHGPSATRPISLSNPSWPSIRATTRSGLPVQQWSSPSDLSAAATRNWHEQTDSSATGFSPGSSPNGVTFSTATKSATGHGDSRIGAAANDALRRPRSVELLALVVRLEQRASKAQAHGQSNHRLGPTEGAIHFV